MIKLADKNSCTGCMACVDACPKKAISGIIEQDGHWYPHLSIDKCIECGLCVKSCPVDKPYTNTNSTSKAYAAWSNNSDFRQTSSSGGVFPTISQYIIENGGYVAGVCMENSQAKHIVISDVKDIPLLQGSKYQQSDSRGVYAKCRELLIENKLVLFSGTPCQVAGLLSYLKKPYQNLITIDVICAGVPSRLVIDKYRKEVPNSQVVTYRDKVYGWTGLNMTTIESGVKIRNSVNGDILGEAVAGHQTDRYSCYDCKFVGESRKADITIGDFWGGGEYFPEQKNRGLSVLIVHSNKGLDVIDKSGVEYHQIPLINAIKKNPRIVIGTNIVGKYRLERIFLTKWINSLSYKNYAALYGGKYSAKWHLLIKLYRYAMWKLGLKYSVNKIKKYIRTYNEC